MPNSAELMPAINVLQTKYDDAMKTAFGIRDALNMLRAEAGMAPISEATAGGAGTPTVNQIKSDTFYGKRQQTAVREYLEMRKAQDLGPAKPREIFDALTLGGFKYEAKDDATAMVGLRALLRKRTAIFHKMPNGAYGLTAWYPHAKKAGPAAEADDDDMDTDDEDAAAAPDDAAAD